ncbi:MAG: NAD(P)-dependent oxidoreductase [Candidatus Aminicenantes bacterium]|nr:MAG: NAD(P)-dependent oxidoreductase [Candidatus Aminicenantes bacterium]
MLSMKAFVTGGTGFIGSHLIDFLLQKGIEVHALVRDRNNLKWLKELNISLLEGDLFSIPPIPADIDYVFHAAGFTKASKSADYYTVNQQGTASLFQSLQSQRTLPKKVIYLSSIAAAGPSFEKKPVKEDDAPHPITPYGKSKLMGEQEALNFKDTYPVVILRVAAIYGPRDRDFLRYFNFIKKGILPALSSQQRLLSLCYIKDLIQAIYLCSQKELESGEIINIADPQPYSWDEYGKAAGLAMGKTLKRVRVPHLVIYLGALISEIGGKIRRKPSIFNRDKYKEMKETAWIADVTKAVEKLPFSPQYSLQEAIQETIDWYFNNNWL